MSAHTQSRGWMISLGLAALVVVAAVIARTQQTSEPGQQVANPCLRVGAMECCYLPEDDG